MNGLIRSPPEQPPLSNRNAYTTWPGGVDPTVPLYNTDNQKFGGARRRNTRRRQAKRVTRRNRKANRKANRKNSKKSRKTNRKANRKTNRKSRRASRRSSSRRSRHRGGYATCSPIDTLGGTASIPMTASVCPEGYFQDKGLIA